MVRILVLCLAGLITYSSCQHKTVSVDEAEKKDIQRVMICGIPFGVNYEVVEHDGESVITSVVLVTSHQSISDYEALRNGISQRYGNPDIEDCEGGTGDAEGKFYGRCVWSDAGITLRNIHSDEGGLMIVLPPNILPSVTYLPKSRELTQFIV